MTLSGYRSLICDHRFGIFIRRKFDINKRISLFGALFSLISIAQILNFKTGAVLSTSSLMISFPPNLQANEDFIKANKFIERLTKLIDHDP